MYCTILKVAPSNAVKNRLSTEFSMEILNLFMNFKGFQNFSKRTFNIALLLLFFHKNHDLTQI